MNIFEKMSEGKAATGLIGLVQDVESTLVNNLSSGLVQKNNHILLTNTERCHDDINDETTKCNTAPLVNFETMSMSHPMKTVVCGAINHIVPCILIIWLTFCISPSITLTPWFLAFLIFVFISSYDNVVLSHFCCDKENKLYIQPYSSR